MTNTEALQGVVKFEAQFEAIQQQVYALDHALEMLWETYENEIKPLLLEGAPPVVFASPVTGQIETGANVWGGAWFTATNYAEKYGTLGHYHTGVDLNLPGFADAGKPVYSVADGEIVYSSAVPGWQGLVVVIKHLMADGKPIWTRYAHVKQTLGLGSVKRGQVIGYIADYTPTGKPEGDHLHFDVARPIRLCR